MRRAFACAVQSRCPLVGRISRACPAVMGSVVVMLPAPVRDWAPRLMPIAICLALSGKENGLGYEPEASIIADRPDGAGGLRWRPTCFTKSSIIVRFRTIHKRPAAADHSRRLRAGQIV
jgi:hypothetical protein